MRRLAAPVLLFAALAQSSLSLGAEPRSVGPLPSYRVAQEPNQGTREAAGFVMEIARHALELSKSSNWQGPYSVRLELLQRQATLIQGGQGDVDRYLRFFSTSRLVLWPANPPPPVAAKIRELETASQQLAKSAGRNLDLPPIAASSLASEPVNNLQPQIPAPTAAQLTTTAEQADALAQSIWADVRNQPLPPGGDTLGLRARQDLVGLAETLQNLRVTLEEGADARTRWRSFNENRIRFLSSYHRLPPLDERLPRLIQALEELGESGRRTWGD